MELGLGVHGEAGVASMELTTAKAAVARILQHMTDPASATGLHLAATGERLAVFVNNLGGSSKLEELIVAREVVEQLEEQGHRVVRVWAGHMMTSLEMAGFLVSILKVRLVVMFVVMVVVVPRPSGRHAKCTVQAVRCPGKFFGLG